MHVLDITKRDKKVNLEALRAEGTIPAVYYGQGKEATSISLSRKQFTKVLSEAGESSVVTLKSPDGDKDALIQSIDFHPVTELPIHVDFYLFDKNKKVEVSVSLEFVGVSPAVKDKGAIFVKVLHELNVEALPHNLPHELIVDISTLVNFDDAIHARDIKLPEGVTLIEDADEVVALVSEPKEEKVEEVVADLSTIEVAKKGKVEEEGAEGADAEKKA